jgi:HAD superfamily hydrolase (TIGR01490 family)
MSRPGQRSATRHRSWRRGGPELGQELPDGLRIPGAAFFDLDNTVMRGASMYHVAQGLVDARWATREDLARAAWWQLYFRLVGVEDPEHMAQAREKALALIAGRKVSELQALAEKTVDERLLPRLWPLTTEMIAEHLAAGDEVWLITASPVELAQPLADRLGLTGVLATEPEQVDGYYTGRLKGNLLHGQAKAGAILAMVEKRGIDLERCSAYSDSHNDIPMLTLVGDPCAVNPDTRLLAHALDHGWRIRDFRTGRRAARAVVAGIAVTAVLGAGSVLGGVVSRRLRR